MEEVHDRPHRDVAEIRKMTTADEKSVARVLGQAFYDDPLMGWMVPDDTKRSQRLERVFRISTGRIWLPEDECYVTGGLTGAAMWLPPGKWRIGWLDQVRMFPSFVAALGGDTTKMMKLDRIMEQTHPDHPQHWYLNAMGVIPTHQGQGLGTALMAPVLERCDQDGTPAYLETSTRRGRALYERNGFKVIKNWSLGGNAPLVWNMWREPQP